jgi:hypothetical protein
MGSIDKSMELIDDSIKIWEKHFGRKHLKTAKSIYLKGNLYLRQSLTAESIACIILINLKIWFSASSSSRKVFR